MEFWIALGVILLPMSICLVLLLLFGTDGGWDD